MNSHHVNVSFTMKLLKSRIQLDLWHAFGECHRVFHGVILASHFDTYQGFPFTFQQGGGGATRFYWENGIEKYCIFDVYLKAVIKEILQR